MKMQMQMPFQNGYYHMCSNSNIFMELHLIIFTHFFQRSSNTFVYNRPHGTLYCMPPLFSNKTMMKPSYYNKVIIWFFIHCIMFKHIHVYRCHLSIVAILVCEALLFLANFLETVNRITCLIDDSKREELTLGDNSIDNFKIGDNIDCFSADLDEWHIRETFHKYGNQFF